MTSAIEQLIGNSNRSLNQLDGYWGVKTSSVNFCEDDYTWSHYIAEFHNTWTSLVFVILPLIGIIYVNPLKEWRTVWCYIQLIITGIGSMCLHATLTNWGQAGDEIPMLWMCSAVFYNLITIKQPMNGGFCKWTIIIPCFVIYQTIVYLYFQSLYHIFVAGYLVMVYTIIAWSIKMSFWEYPEHSELRKYLCKRAVGSYVFVGSVVWLIDMHFCDSLQFFINFLGGITPHIFWHLGAGYATYFMILLMIVIRCQHLGRIPTVEWWCMGLIPIVKVIKSADYDQ